MVEETTTPHDFTEQARQLVFTSFTPPYGSISFDKKGAEFLVQRIASALTEAATQGQVIMIERVSKVVCGFCEEGNKVIFINDAFRHHFEGEETPWFPCYADKLRKLSPSPNYLDRVRNEAAYGSTGTGGTVG